MNRVAIAGVGLIGGSFALGLRKAGFLGELTGISSPSTIQAAIARGVITRGTTLEEAAASADVIYLAQPIDQILRTLERLGPIAHSGCLITDAGSTKSLIDAKANECLRFATFLGGHPLAGKEQRGVEHADGDLFRHRPYVLTPSSKPSAIAEQLRKWLTQMGASIVDMTPQHHDKTVALTSHLPQLLSTTLAISLAHSGEDSVTRIFGPGLIDMTRLALSTPDLWTSILETNRPSVLEALRLFQNELSQVVTLFESGDITQLFATAADFSRKIRKA
ncbi:MAG TPA: prephenate dehydrogenase/arogenate dehydrogenase family protein [Bryobacteraceae bacterium]|jgi:prephenate dehydrogenase|nr:prephenate dehydrogenase/arogenate dehydrogenase family protein [Bryobacteraceae bacterium]